jgi:hypothetical protein
MSMNLLQDSCKPCKVIIDCAPENGLLEPKRVVEYKL